MELEDLPPRYRAQAEAQIAARSRGKCVSPQAIPDAARTAGKLGKAFESRGEYEYYMSVIVPGIQSGKILKATTHVRPSGFVRMCRISAKSESAVGKQLESPE